MALTLIEAAKKNDGTVIQNAIIEIYAQSVDILRALPFENIAGNALRYNQEGTLPGIGFRGINEGYTESVGVLNPVTEPLVIAGGDLDVDKFILKTMGMDQRSAQEAMKVKALAHQWANTFIKGDTSTAPKQYDGLQTRLTGAQLVSNGSTSGGDPLSLINLDAAIDAVDGATHLYMSQAMRRHLTSATRGAGTVFPAGGFITYTQDEFGRQVAMYQGLPILIADANDNNNPTLAFDEAGAGGGSTATSIYVLSLSPGMLGGIQNGIPEVTDIGELEAKPVLRTRVEWYAGIALWHPRAAARLYGISDAAVVA